MHHTYTSALYLYLPYTSLPYTSALYTHAPILCITFIKVIAVPYGYIILCITFIRVTPYGYTMFILYAYMHLYHAHRGYALLLYIYYAILLRVILYEGCFTGMCIYLCIMYCIWFSYIVLLYVWRLLYWHVYILVKHGFIVVSWILSRLHYMCLKPLLYLCFTPINIPILSIVNTLLHHVIVSSYREFYHDIIYTRSCIPLYITFTILFTLGLLSTLLYSTLLYSTLLYYTLHHLYYTTIHYYTILTTLLTYSI